MVGIFIYGVVLVGQDLIAAHKIRAEKKQQEADSAFDKTNDLRKSASPYTQPAPQTEELEAIVTCSFNGNNFNVQVCFLSRSINTTLELKNGEVYGLYKHLDLHRLMKNNSLANNQALHIKIKKPFFIEMQNANNLMILGLVIKDVNTGKILFQKQVDQYGVISFGDE